MENELPLASGKGKKGISLSPPDKNIYTNTFSLHSSDRLHSAEEVLEYDYDDVEYSYDDVEHAPAAGVDWPQPPPPPCPQRQYQVDANDQSAELTSPTSSGSMSFSSSVSDRLHPLLEEDVKNGNDDVKSICAAGEDCLPPPPRQEDHAANQTASTSSDSPCE
ncbi:uncharacterized protein LOC135360312 [Latimeria chalumnae]|uniref:uncharacterized protein LOC135360312 n=1 Tax=Latimeria chalumnae TaxID=7897 RepID=UPI00313EAD31